VKLSVLGMAALLVGVPALINAQDMDTAFQQLKDAEAKGDAAQVKKLSAEVSALAKKAAAEPAPADADAKEGWTNRVDYARQVQDYSEYALLAVALKSQPATTLELGAALEALNPKSKYLENEDLLLALANSTFSAKQYDRALGFANRLVAAATKHTKPDDVAQADWDKRRAAYLGAGNWIAGVANFEKSLFPAADRSLRAALPYIRGNDAQMAAALFRLGVANYNLGKMTNNKARILEAAKFSDDCAKISSEYADQASRNSAAMRTDAAKMR
jgi:hypothetical protein